MEDPYKRLANIQNAWGTCERCQIGTWAFKHVFFDGSSVAKFMFIGEGPGVSEDALGVPFIGSSGRLLRDVLETIFEKDDWCLTNLVACRPCNGPRETNRAPSVDEVLACEERLHNTISAVRPKVLVAVGVVPSKYLGEFFSNYKIQRIKHPSYILRNGGTKAKQYNEWVGSIKKIKEGTE